MNAQQITTASTTVVPILIALTYHQVTLVAARVVTPVFQPTSTKSHHTEICSKRSFFGLKNITENDPKLSDLWA